MSSEYERCGGSSSGSGSSSGAGDWSGSASRGVKAGDCWVDGGIDGGPYIAFRTGYSQNNGLAQLKTVELLEGNLCARLADWCQVGRIISGRQDHHMRPIFFIFPCEDPHRERAG
jgi:hypothetical protein